MGKLRLIGIGLCWGTLLVIAGATVRGVYVYSQINHEVQKYVLAELKKQYPELNVRIGSAHIVENKGIAVTKIEISVPQRSRKPQPLLHIDELFVECSITLQSLYQKNPKISRVVVSKPILRISRFPDGTFPELQLLAGTGDDHPYVPVEVENGTLLYDDARHPAAPPLQLSGINFTVTPEMPNQASRLLVKGSADDDFFRRITFEAEILPETTQWKFTANCRQFDWSDNLWQYIPPLPELQEHNQERPRFQGRFDDFNVSAVSDPAAELGCRFAVGGTLTHGRIGFPHINRTLTELSTRFEVTNERIVIDKLTGSGDGSQFSASFVQEGLPFSGSRHRRAELTVNVRNLRFDGELVTALAPFLNDATEELLARYEYEGMTDLHARLFCQNGVWHPKTISMQISEVGFAYRAFPYRVDRLAGEMHLDEAAALHFRFTSKQDAPLKAVIEGHYSNIFVDPAGKVEIIGEDVPIDQKLIRVLPPEVQKVADSLHPAGKLKARLIFELPPGDVPFNRRFDIALDHVSLRYDYFPYPLRDVTGLLNYDGNVWQFRDVSGTNGTAVVKGNGYLRPAGSVYDHAQEFVLDVSAEELPVDDQITQALLNPDQRQLLQSLNVNGKVNLAAQIQYRTDGRNLNLSFQAVPQPGLSIQPDRIPYKIEDINGEIRYKNGHVVAKTLRGTHRNTKLRSGLDCRFDVEGQSVLQLSLLEIDQLQADRELLDALPQQLRDFLESLQITRPFSLSGGIEHRQTAQGEQAVRWDLNCILFQNSAKLGMSFENISGTVRLWGRSTADRLQLDGNLNVDALMVNGFYVTSVRGPFSFDGTLLRLGVPAHPMTPAIPAQPLTGKFCDGTIRTLGLVTLGSGITYDIRAELIEADLAKVVREFEPAAQKTSGTLNCTNLKLQGIGTKWETVDGIGTIQLREANIYGAPVMVRLLRELRIKEKDPDAGMFSSMDVEFRLKGLQMILDSVVFEGGAASLHGDGIMRLDNRQVDLTMKTRLGNRRMQIPLISDVIGGVGDQLVQLRVTGPISDPAVTRVVVPEVQRVVQQIQPEGTPPPPSASRSRLAPSKMFQWNPF